MNTLPASLESLAERFRRGLRLSELDFTRLLTNGMNFLTTEEYQRLRSLHFAPVPIEVRRLRRYTED